MERYVMGYSQADGCNIVVFADSREEAEVKYENGEFTLEDEEPAAEGIDVEDRVVRVNWDTDGESPEECGLPDEVTIPWWVPDDGVADYCSDIYGYCVESWFNVES